MKVAMTVRGQADVPGGSGVPGGQVGMIQIARALGRLGVAVDLFIGGARMKYLDGLGDVSPTHFRWPAGLDRIMRSGPAFVAGPTRRFRQRRWLDAVQALPGIGSADVIHVQGLRDAELLLSRLRGPIVVTHWGRVGRWRSDDREPEKNLDLANRCRSIRENATLVAIGEAQGKDMTSVGLPPAAVIPPGIDLGHFTPGDRAEARMSLGLAANGRVVLYVGRLAADKNVGTLLKAFARLPAREESTHLVIVGDGPLRTELQELSAALGVDRRTSFVRFVPHENLPLHYRAADVAVVPSDQLETFCMVALEALACGCPLVVTDQVPEIVRHFPDVAVTEPYDIDGLCRHIDTAISADRPPAEAARVAGFGWDAVARRYLDLYESARRHTRGSP